MAAKLMMVNPRKRGAKGRFVKVKKSAPRRKATTITVRANPVTPLRKRRVKRRAVSTAKVMRRRRRNPAPLMSVKGLMKSAIMPSVVSAVGALGLDVAMGYINEKLPPEYQVGLGGTAVRFAASVGLGLVAGKVKGREFGQQVMVGGLTVTLHNLLRASLQQAQPDMKLGVYSDGLGVYSDGMGAYTTSSGYDVPRLGYYSPAKIAGLGAGEYSNVQSNGAYSVFI